MRALGMVIFFALAAVGVIYAVRYNYANGLVVSPPAASVVLAVAPSTILTGTIDYQPNNTGTIVPYLVYQSGGVKTKALVFTEDSACITNAATYPCTLIAQALESYYGGETVYAEGIVDDENLIVSRLMPA